MTNTDLNIIDILKRNSKLTHSDLSLDEKEFAKYKNVLELLEKASEVSSELRSKLEKLYQRLNLFLKSIHQVDGRSGESHRRLIWMVLIS